MVEDKTLSESDVVSDNQLMRAVTSFEAIITSQIDIKNKLGDRLNYAIRTGIIILGILAISILILLLTLSSQIGRISNVVGAMNQDFLSVSSKMHEMNRYIDSMEQRVALLQEISSQTESMYQEMEIIAQDMEVMSDTMLNIKSRVQGVRHNIGNISLSIDQMNHNVQRMGVDMHRMGKSARTMNKMFPFP